MVYFSKIYILNVSLIDKSDITYKSFYCTIIESIFRPLNNTKELNNSVSMQSILEIFDLNFANYCNSDPLTCSCKCFKNIPFSTLKYKDEINNRLSENIIGDWSQNIIEKIKNIIVDDTNNKPTSTQSKPNLILDTESEPKLIAPSILSPNSLFRLTAESIKKSRKTSVVTSPLNMSKRKSSHTNSNFFNKLVETSVLNQTIAQKDDDALSNPLPKDISTLVSQGRVRSRRSTYSVIPLENSSTEMPILKKFENFNLADNQRLRSKTFSLDFASNATSPNPSDFGIEKTSNSASYSASPELVSSLINEDVPKFNKKAPALSPTKFDRKRSIEHSFGLASSNLTSTHSSTPLQTIGFKASNLGFDNDEFRPKSLHSKSSAASSVASSPISPIITRRNSNNNIEQFISRINNLNVISPQAIKRTAPVVVANDLIPESDVASFEDIKSALIKKHSNSMK